MSIFNMVERVRRVLVQTNPQPHLCMRGSIRCGSFMTYAECCIQQHHHKLMYYKEDKSRRLFLKSYIRGNGGYLISFYKFRILRYRVWMIHTLLTSGLYSLFKSFILDPSYSFGITCPLFLLMQDMFRTRWLTFMKETEYLFYQYIQGKYNI